MSVVIGIDVGGSTTKIVGFRTENGKNEIIAPQCVHANDPLTATYGAFGKFTDENGISLKEIDKIMMTGVGSAYVKNGIYGVECFGVPEFESIGLGAIYLSKLDNVLAVSMGTGTALVHATSGGKMSYLGGTGVGGGTIIGLSKLLLHAENVENISELAEHGDLSKIDLRIGDITAPNMLTSLSRDLTAANFANVSDLATKEDIARGVMNMVFETVAMVSVFAARQSNVKDVILTGNLTRLPLCEQKFKELAGFGYGVNFIIPENSEFATVIGSALAGITP